MSAEETLAAVRRWALYHAERVDADSYWDEGYANGVSNAAEEVLVILDGRSS